VKLAPERTSLSGRPEFLRAAPVQTSAPAPVVPTCAMCRLVDTPHMIGSEPHHTVTVELKFIDAPNDAAAKLKITPYLKARGWKYRMHLGRHSMERYICRECLERHAILEGEFQRKRSQELKSSMNSDSYYLALCGD
jgi:hypothetical protein